MTEKTPERFDDVTVICKANIFFEGKVVSHTILFKDGSKKTIGLIQPVLSSSIPTPLKKWKLLPETVWCDEPARSNGKSTRQVKVFRCPVNLGLK